MRPQEIKSRYAQAVQQIALGQLTPAESTLKALLSPTNGAAEVHFQLSRIAEARGDSPAQAEALDRALEKRPDEKALLHAAVEANARLGKSDKALALYDRLIALEPNMIKPRAEKALYLQNLGRFDAAEKILRSLIKKKPQDGELYRMLTGSYRFKPRDPLLAQMKTLWNDARQNDYSRMQVGFALAKAMEDNKAHDKVFGYLNPANALQRKLYPFDRAAHEAEHAAMIAAQDGADLTPQGPQMPVRPVFVTGLPRSGTTLVEQIIASHSAVAAGGELAHAVRLAISMLGDGKTLPPLDTVPDEKLSAFTEAYARHVRRDTGVTSGVVTDKSMLNHLIYGLLRRAMPGARMIVVHRDPRDIALSIYRNHFKVGTHRYANDLADIAAVIKAFRANIAHWRARLPAGALHEVRYEDLVTDPEPQVRALIDAAGLDWQDPCLDFHRAKGTVKTLSLHQVRQPIHTGATQGWRKFETELAPFIAAWGDQPWD